MSNALRKLSCRAGFVLFCVAPTSLLVGWIVLSRSSYYHERQRSTIEQALEENLAVDVSLERWQGLPDGGFLLENLRLSDPETGSELATVRLVEVSYADDQLRLLASQPEVQGAALPRLWELLHDRLLRRRGDFSTGFAAREVTLHAEGGAQTFTDLRGAFGNSASGPQLSLEFRIAGAPATESTHIRIVRNRQLNPPATGWALRTGDTALPCWMLADRFPFLKQLGPNCRFRGAIWASLTGDGWEGDVSGEFQKVDFYNLVSESFPHKLTGEANALVTVARFEKGQLIEASGEIRSPHGVVSKSLLQASADHLGLTLNDAALPRDDQRVLYQDLGLAFRLDEGGLRIAAVPDAPTSGVIVSGDFGWLCAESADQTVPVISLVRALVPESQLQVPATQQTNTLIGALPVPSVVADRNVAREKYVPLRLRIEDE